MTATPGYYQPPGVTAPIFDPAGTYTNTSGATAPTQAPAGTYVGTTGATAATTDMAGTFTSTAGSTAPTQAPAGTYVGTAGATAATTDMAGTFTSTAGSTAPTQAPAGTYVGTAGATAATIDMAGTFTSTAGSTAPTQAPAGTYVGTAGATAATIDMAGTFTSTPGSTAPTQAPAGTYVGTTGATAAIVAPPGTYVSTPGATAPTVAPAGYYDPGTGNTAPIPLPATFTPGTSGLSIGYWAHHQNNPAWTQTGNQGDVLLGQGAAPIGDLLLVPAAAATELISGNGSAGDVRQLLISQAEATQLNINAGANDPGAQTAGQDLIAEAVYWLEGRSLTNGSPSFIYSDHSSGNVDANHNGAVDTGTSGAAPAIDYNSATRAFTFEGADGFQVANKTLAPDANAWQTLVDTGVMNPLTGTDFMVDGEGLKNALQAFNQGQLVTSANDQLVGWFNGSAVTDSHMNNAAGMWTVLKDAGIAGIS